jgi:hypothetical protein
MPHHEDRTITGIVTHIFGHRFVVRTEQGDVLADLTPKGLERVTPRLRDTVTLEGEMKPTELKVTRFIRDGHSVEVEHKKKRHDHEPA